MFTKLLNGIKDVANGIKDVANGFWNELCGVFGRHGGGVKRTVRREVGAWMFWVSAIVAGWYSGVLLWIIAGWLFFNLMIAVCVIGASVVMMAIGRKLEEGGKVC